MNIAEILEYCPKGTKLYSLIDGEVTLERVENYKGVQYPIEVTTNNHLSNYYTKDGLFSINRPGECILFPSKDQRDWSKFKLPVKRGDIMMRYNGTFPFISNGVITEYGGFEYICGFSPVFGDLRISNLSGSSTVWTSDSCIPASEEVKKKLFDKMEEAGYRWNADTLELEKIEPKFKEGDILINKNTNKLFLFTGGRTNNIIQCYLLFGNTLELYGLPISSFKLASEEDRNKIYFTLAKKGYVYDKEQHKLTRRFKPFDKVLVRNLTDEKWSINLFSYYDKENKLFPHVCLDGRYNYCVPY